MKSSNLLCSLQYLEVANRQELILTSIVDDLADIWFVDTHTKGHGSYNDLAESNEIHR